MTGGMRVIIACITALLFAALTACASHRLHSAPNFPTFEDIRAIPGDPLEDTESLMQLTSLVQRLQFTRAQYERVRMEGGHNHWIGAGTLAPLSEWRGMMLLRMAVEQEPENALQRAALAQRALALFVMKSSHVPNLDEVIDAFAQWERLEPENAAPCYLKAALYAHLQWMDEAHAALDQATQKPHFATHAHAMRRCAAAASEFAGHSPFMARMRALAETPAMLPLYRLASTMLEAEQPETSVAQQCLLLGRRMEKSAATYMEELGAIAIQKRSLRLLPQEQGDGALLRLDRRADYIQRVSSQAWAWRRMVSEERWVRFYDEALDATEDAAFERLLRELYPEGGTLTASRPLDHSKGWSRSKSGV